MSSRPARRRSLVTLVVLTALTAPALPSGQGVVQEHLTGLRAPAKLLALPGGELLVAEAGGPGANTGRISYVDRAARRFTVIDGLPSALFLGRDASGPSGLVLGDRRLYVTIGGGDTTIAGAGANSEIPNPQVSSPLFSSVLLLEFPDAAGGFSTGFTLARADQDALAADRAVYLRNADGEAVRVSRLVDVPSYVAEPRPDEPRHVRTSNLYGAVGGDSGLALVDASMNVIWTVALAPGGPLTRLAGIGSVVNPLFPSLGPPSADAVPASIRVAGDDFVISLLTGFPFGPRAASVLRVSRRTGAVTTVATGLQTAVDVLPIPGTADEFYVVEYSSAFLAGGPGRVLRVDATRGTTLVMADGLRTPTHLAPDTRTGDLFVTDNAGGRILRVLVPH
ncbi:MAG: ScyD/ScyE family protein [Vicinamibacterales bacterium]